MRKIVISYRRFSSKPQEKGTSLARQNDDAVSYCAKRGWTLDANPIIDGGASAFHGKHMKSGELGRFVAAVEKHPEKFKGKILLVEDLSRLSRLGICETQALVSRILVCGVDIATINPEFYLTADDRNDLPKVMQLVVYADMYYKQSLDKSRYSKKAWVDKWEKAKRTPISAKGPSWLQLVDGAWEIIDWKADIVRRIFALAIEGLGCEAICRRFNTEGVPPIAKAKTWQKGYVLLILNGRSVLGEYVAGGRSQQNKAPRTVITGYYPAIIDDQTYYAAQNAIAARKHRQYGPRTNTVLILQSLCKDKASGSTMHTVTKPQRDGSKRKELIPSAAIQAKAKFWSVPLQYVTDAVILAVHELRIEQGGKPQADPLVALESQLAGLAGKIKATEAAIDTTPNIASLLAILQKLGTQHAKVTEQIETMKAERTNSPQDSLVQFRSAWLSLKDCRTEEERQTLLASIRQRLRLLVDRIELTKKDKVVSGTIHYRTGDKQNITIENKKYIIGGKYD